MCLNVHYLLDHLILSSMSPKTMNTTYCICPVGNILHSWKNSCLGFLGSTLDFLPILSVCFTSFSTWILNTFLFFFFPFLIHILQVWIHSLLGNQSPKAKFLFYISKSYTQWTIQHTCKINKLNHLMSPLKWNRTSTTDCLIPVSPSSLSNTHIHTMAPNKKLNC